MLGTTTGQQTCDYVMYGAAARFIAAASESRSTSKRSAWVSNLIAADLPEHPLNDLTFAPDWITASEAAVCRSW